MSLLQMISCPFPEARDKQRGRGREQESHERRVSKRSRERERERLTQEGVEADTKAEWQQQLPILAKLATHLRRIPTLRLALAPLDLSSSGSHSILRDFCFRFATRSSPSTSLRSLTPSPLTSPSDSPPPDLPCCFLSSLCDVVCVRLPASFLARTPSLVSHALSVSVSTACVHVYCFY